MFIQEIVSNFYIFEYLDDNLNIAFSYFLMYLKTTLCNLYGSKVWTITGLELLTINLKIKLFHYLSLKEIIDYYIDSMFKLFIAILLFGSVSAFRCNQATRLRRYVKMDASNIEGALPPLGYFDPLGLSKGKTSGEIKKYREAELKHGRVSMLSVLGMLTAESFNPFFGGKISGPAIFQFQQADQLFPLFWVLVLFSISLVESQNILTGWESVAETVSRGGSIAQLKETYVNGLVI
jgi:hypothetical protein